MEYFEMNALTSPKLNGMSAERREEYGEIRVGKEGKGKSVECREYDGMA